MFGLLGEHAGSAPWSFLRPHLERPWSFLLDRAGSAEPSFAGSLPSCALVIACDGSAARLDANGSQPLDGDPIDIIETFVEESRSTPRTLPQWVSPDSPLPRTVGYLAYELGTYIEDVPRVTSDPVGAPLAVLATYDRVDAWHPATGATAAIVFSDSPRVLLEPLRKTTALPEKSPSSRDERLSYETGFAHVKDAIASGDIYQANLSRRIAFALRRSPAEAYRSLRRRQPVAHGAYLDLGDWQLLSNSPECFLRIDGEIIRTFPIKGTRPRALERAQDRALSRELARDPKERAEHLMIVDLERNDLGRICRIGSVTVPAFAEIISFATLHHMVSEVRGCLTEEQRLASILRATFPGGSITGAPKIRAMEIIAEVEHTARGVYTGAIGFMNGSRSLELSIAIRTAIATDDTLHYSSGGGIVADSEMNSEWAETETKAQALVDSLRGTSGGDTRAIRTNAG